MSDLYDTWYAKGYDKEPPPAFTADEPIRNDDRTAGWCDGLWKRYQDDAEQMRMSNPKEGKSLAITVRPK